MRLHAPPPSPSDARHAAASLHCFAPMFNSLLFPVFHVFPLRLSAPLPCRLRAAAAAARGGRRAAQCSAGQRTQRRRPRRARTRDTKTTPSGKYTHTGHTSDGDKQHAALPRHCPLSCAPAVPPPRSAAERAARMQACSRIHTPLRGQRLRRSRDNRPALWRPPPPALPPILSHRRAACRLNAGLRSRSPPTAAPPLLGRAASASLDSVSPRCER